MSRVRFLTVSHPDPSEVAEDYADIVQRGIFTNSGPVERAFSEELQEFIGEGAHVSLLANATVALELGIQTVVRTGTRVIVPSFTFAAGALAVRRCGFRPEFVDISLDTWQPDLAHAHQLLSRNEGIGGILLTSTFGVGNPEITRWENLANDQAIPLIVDSAAGFGSTYTWGEPLGLRGTCEVFSFHATKAMGIGEGGILVSRDPQIVATVEELKNFGFDAERRAVHAGTNAKLTELAAAIGRRQLRTLPVRLQKRRRIVAMYAERLEPLGVQFQPGVRQSAPPFVSALMPTAESRDRLVRALDAAEVETRVYYNPPVHRHPIFEASDGNRSLPNTDTVAARIISLPMGDDLAPSVIEFVARIAEQVVRG
jgi:dTDP-4-amino-4,6-dideoxygalactose transaminase